MKKIRFKIVDKYLLKEFFSPFLFSVAVLIVIMLSGYLFQITDLMIVKNIRLVKVLKLLVYKIPELMVQSLAISVLFATLLSINELVKDNELMAFRLGGISLGRLVIPLLIIALLVSSLVFILNEKIIPWTNHQAETIVRKIMIQEGLPNLQPGIFITGEEGRHFYIKEINHETGALQDILIYQLSEDEEKFPKLIKAKSGYFKKKRWHLKEGLVYYFDREGNLVNQSSFEELEIDVKDKLTNFHEDQKTTAEMSRSELRSEIKTFQENGLETHSLMVDYHLKLAKPIVCLIFVLVGIPLSIRVKQEKSFSLLTSIIIIFIYYLTLSFCRSLGREALLPPLLAAWLPNILFGLVGIYLIVREEYY